MRYKYCPECGAKLTEILSGDEGITPYCEACGKRWFDTFQSCVIVLTYNEFDEVVLARQGYLSDKYASFTSGYMTPGETAEETALREVREELGIELESLEYAGTYWFAAKDMLMHGFIGFTRKKKLHLSQEVDSAEWVNALDAPKTMFPDGPGNSAYAIYRKFLKMRGLNPAT
ncbi:MAG: NUDIX domain-containing protein [Synergistaceae bacterium]|nr:NUDIX domain-containing protein [Synergistaceae bacterium]MBR0150716.1 NUDIX domain-containing protein [Synergistaceae bacterium]